MNARPVVDLLVIGADVAGAAAAACAARRGASVAMMATGGEAPAFGLIDEPPDFVWRILDLHLRGLDLEPPAAHTTKAGAEALTTTRDAARTSELLAARGNVLEHLWPAFTASMNTVAGRDFSSPEKFLSANALLDDYFADELLKAHLVSSCLAPFGLAGDEAGSAAALACAAAPARRRVRAGALVEALAAIADEAGVEKVQGKLSALIRTDGKTLKAVSDSGREMRAKAAMASSALIGEAAGLRISCEGSPLVRRAGAEALIRIRYEKRAPQKGEGSVYHTAADREAIARARDAMIDGRIEDEPHLSFETDGKEIVARAAFCPAAISDGGEMRDWTGQDRQILGRRAASVIEKTLGVDLGPPREIEVFIGADAKSGLQRRSFDMPAIIAPAPSADPVGAAAKLALELVGHE